MANNFRAPLTTGSSRSQHFHGEFSKMYFWTRVIDEEVRKQSLNCNPVKKIQQKQQKNAREASSSSVGYFIVR